LSSILYLKTMKKLLFFLLPILIIGCETNPKENIESFDSAWNRINDVYPFLEFKKINWDSIYTIYRPKVESANRKEFKLIINDMLSELEDVHVYHRKKVGIQRYPYKSPRQIKDKNAISKSVIRKYFNERLKFSKGVLYGISPENIGYIRFKSFHNKGLIVKLPEIFKYLSNTKGLIVDLRSPKGGDYNVLMAFVNYFMTTPLEKPELYILEKIEQSPFQASESEYIYTKPAVVLINGLTISAGESTAEILKQLPNVTVVGDTTCGGGGCSSNHTVQAIGEYELPNSLLISVPTGYFKRYDGSHLEWNGVSPDVRVKQTETDINNSKDKQLEFAFSHLNK